MDSDNDNVRPKRRRKNKKPKAGRVMTMEQYQNIHLDLQEPLSTLREVLEARIKVQGFTDVAQALSDVLTKAARLREISLQFIDAVMHDGLKYGSQSTNRVLDGERIQTAIDIVSGVLEGAYTDEDEDAAAEHDNALKDSEELLVILKECADKVLNAILNIRKLLERDSYINKKAEELRLARIAQEPSPSPPPVYAPIATTSQAQSLPKSPSTTPSPAFNDEWIIL